MDNKPSKNKPSLDVDRLLSQIGSRTEPDQEKTIRTQAVVHQRWQQAVLKQQQRRKQKISWAIAASVMLMATVTLFNFNQNSSEIEPIMFATTTNFSGDIQIRHASGESWRTLQSNEAINAGTTIKTNSINSFLAMQLNDNSEIRMAGNTELIISSLQLELIQGQIYHDTDESYAAAPLIIKTNHGYVQHIGTRYMVSQEQETTKVAVRSGQVKLTPIDSTQTQKTQTIEHNQLATLSNNKPASLSTISSNDELWNWTFVAQSTFNLDNKSLYDFIKWYAHQAGLTVDWQGFESPSKRVRLQGNIHNMTAAKAIETVFYSTQYSYSINEGVLQIYKQ